jgi:hypothetical protein
VKLNVQNDTLYLNGIFQYHQGAACAALRATQHSAAFLLAVLRRCARIIVTRGRRGQWWQQQLLLLQAETVDSARPLMRVRK